MSKQKVPFFILIILFIHCAPDEQNQFAKTLINEIELLNLSKNYEFSIKNKGQHLQEIYFLNKVKKWISTGDVFEFKTSTEFYIKDFYLSNLHSEKTKSQQYFRLYINDRLTGKYRVNKRVIINKKVTAIRVLFLKTDAEYIVEGWKGTTILKLIKTDNANKKLFSPEIKLSIRTKQKLILNLSKIRQPFRKKSHHLNKAFLRRFISGDYVVASGLRTDKKSPKTIQYNVYLNKNGTFRLYQLVSDNVNKKILQEFFLKGFWQCTELNAKSAKLELTGKLNGYFPDKKPHIVKDKYIKVISEFNDMHLRSDRLIDEIYFDFPYDALVNVKSFIPDVVSDMAYAGVKNFTGEKLYSCNKGFLRYEVAKALNKVQKRLKKDKMSLKLFDCYRPFSVQAVLFEKFPVPGYVADPIGGSSHNRGSAVDLTIIDKNGKALDMGTEFDELSIKSNHSYLNFSDTILKNRTFLVELMQSCNFTPIRSEWWHYNYLYARKFPKVNDEFLCD